MGKRGIVFGVTTALIVLGGCAAHERTNAVARSTEQDVRPSALPADLVGTWRGSFWPVGADAGGVSATGNMTLGIKDDGTYTLLIERRGGSTQNDSGVAVANGHILTLRSSSGRSLSLSHRGDALYGVTPARTSGYMVQISVEKESGALASPASDASAR